MRVVARLAVVGAWLVGGCGGDVPNAGPAVCPHSPAPAARGTLGEWRSGEHVVRPGVWSYYELVRDSGAAAVHGYVALLRVAPGGDRRSGGGGWLPGGRRPRVSATWFDRLPDTLRYDAERRVLQVAGTAIPIDSGNVVLVDASVPGRPTVVRQAGCVELSPPGTAADRALATLPAARSFASGE